MTPETPIDRFEIFANGLDHPECVAFDRDGNCWAGGEAGQVYRVDPAGRVETVATLGGFTGGIAFSPSDELFVCNPSLGVVHVRRDGRHEVFATHAGGHRLAVPNFPVFDRAGNLYVTDSGTWMRPDGALARFSPDGSGEVIACSFGYANGLALAADERTLYMVESDANRVLRFAMAADGPFGPAEVFVENAGRLPDGLALDDAGDLYVSCYASDDVYRVTSDGRKSLFAYDPFARLLSRPTNIAFHGEWMYVANLGRTTVTRAKVDVRGQKLVNLR